MKRLFTLFLMLCLLLSSCTKSIDAPKSKTHKYTGIITEVNDNQLTISANNQLYTFPINDAQNYTRKSTVEITIDKNNTLLTAKVIKDYTIEDYINETLSTMSLDEKVGQLFLVRLDPNNVSSQIQEYHIGGLILFAKHFQYETKESITHKLSSYQAQSTLPLLVAVDEEGGSVNRISKYSAFRGVPFWSSQDLYKEGKWNLIISDTIEKARLLKSIGINVNMAPVADVSENPNDYIYERSFGKGAMQTSGYITKVIRTMKQEQIGSVLKHFPGYGNNTDTHTGIAIDKRPYETFLTSDFLPFIAGIEEGADAVLVSHNIVTSMDEVPSSLSSKVHAILRQELGFEGVIITDDLKMGAIQEYTNNQNAAVSAILAGNDLLCTTDYKEQIEAVTKAVEENIIPVAQLDASIRRLLRWKYKLSLIEF